MGRQVCGGANGLDGTAMDRTGRGHVSTAPTLADVVPMPRPRRTATKLARVWIHLRQEAASGELSPRSPTPPPPSGARRAHPSFAWRQTRTGRSRLYVVRPPDDAA
jgi:hypothetical protein